MDKVSAFCLASILTLALVVGCAAPAPTATPTQPPAVAPTPTKAPTATPTKRPITKVEVVQASITSIAHATAYVAREKGYFLDHGLDVSFLAAGSGAKALAAIVGRSALIGLPAAPDVVTAIAQGQPARAFAQLSTGAPYWLIIRKEVADQRGITAKMTLEEKGRAVKGLTFAATSPGSGSDYRVRYFLRKAGLDPDRDVNITYMSSAAMPPAFEIGAIDSFTAGSPESVLPPIEQGKAVILVDFAGGELPGTADNYNIVAVSHRDELERQPEIFEAYASGLWRAMKFIAEREAEARDLVRKTYLPDMDPALYQKAWELSRPGLSKEPTITAERLKATLDYRNDTEPPPPLELKFDDFGTNRFVEAAKKQLGY